MADATPPEHLQCHGQSRQKKKRCTRRKSPGSNYCIFHGSRNPSGPLSKKYIHGRRSKSLAGKLLATYEEAISDPQITNLSDSIAMCDVRIDNLANQLEKAEGVPDVLKHAYHLLGKAMDQENPELHGGLLQELSALLLKGASADQVWEKILVAIEQRRRVSESESRRIVSMGQAVPIQKVLELITLVCNSFRHTVESHADRETSNLILRDASRDVNRIIGSGGMREPVSAGGTSTGPEDPLIVTVGSDIDPFT